VKENFFSKFPWLDKIHSEMNGTEPPEYREVNSHIHTPYSFSAFDTLDTAFAMAKDENIAVLGINDFYVTDGYEAFAKGCLQNKIFPLFNIEFIGLLKEEQKQGIRINDPNNPGRIYFSGKGLDTPFSPGFISKIRMKKMIGESQSQMKAMIGKLNALLAAVDPSLSVTYEDIKGRYAKELVRERHLAKAVRKMAEEKFGNSVDQVKFLESLYGGKSSKAGMMNPAQLENEIRSNLLKSGGPAFVPENESSFLPLKKIISLISDAGGIPCYPVLLDDPSGKCTEFEEDAGKLIKKLMSLKVECIELIPGRNDINTLRKFVDYFYNEGFVILFGTEHNTPELSPLTVSSRGQMPLDESLKRISWEGACVVAAHQYLRAHGRQGYMLEDGKPSRSQRDELFKIGQMIIEYYLKHGQDAKRT
jgi:hypothetical protein